MTTCALCDQPAHQRVQNISRKSRKVLSDESYCAEHVQTQITLASTPGLGMTDIAILPLPTEGAICEKCGNEVVKVGWFWVLPSEVGGRATYCPAGGHHDVDEDNDD